MISLLKEIMKKWQVKRNHEYALEYPNLEFDNELEEIITIFPEFNYHNHYFGKLYQCSECCEHVAVDKVSYISIEMFEAEYYYCINCTSKKIMLCGKQHMV